MLDLVKYFAFFLRVAAEGFGKTFEHKIEVFVLEQRDKWHREAKK